VIVFSWSNTIMNRPRFFIVIALLVFSHAGSANSLFAQTSGKIAGVVKDGQTGEALPGANVMIEGSTLGAASDAKGYYMILRVPPGNHTIIVSYLGYQKVLVKNVEVLTDHRQRGDSFFLWHFPTNTRIQPTF
ncbi:MAG: carboxypeptidase-like regulatory domain-containing protein, partial [bacterium]